MVLDIGVACTYHCGGARAGRQDFELVFRVSTQKIVLRRESAEQFLEVGKLAEHIAVVAEDYRFGAHEV